MSAYAALAAAYYKHKKPLTGAALVLRGTTSGKTRIDGKIDNLIKFNVQFEFDKTKLLF